MLSFYILFLIPLFLIHPHKCFSMQLGPSTAFLACARLIVTFAPFNAWYRAAWRIDQACLANEAFQSMSRSAPSTLLKTASTWPPPLSIVRLPPTPPLLATPKPLLPTLSVGIPMDVDASRRTKSLPPWGCYWCGDKNHLVRDCSHHMDVRQFILEQQEELMEDLLVLKDTVLVEETCPPEEKDFA